MLLSDPFQQPKAAELATILQGASIEVACTFSEAAMHAPTNVTNNAVERANRPDADSIMSVGGGSSIGLGNSSAQHDHTRTVYVPIMSVAFVARQSPKKAFFCYQGEPGCSFVE
jgi:alcohol dehydrogenase class IV